MNQNNFYPSCRPRFFRDCPRIAYAVRTTAIHTSAGFPARGIKPLVTQNILRGCPRTNTLHGCFYIRNNFVDTDKEHDIFRSESNATHTISNHVQID